ncbi:MAG: PAS domain S-box protein [Candidatus Omnitrophota bacterium]
MDKNKDVYEILKESEEKFSKIFNSSVALMALSTLEKGKFIDVNEEFLSVLGYEKFEVIGKTSKELGIFQNYAIREEIKEKIKQNLNVKNYILEIKTKSGDIRQGLFSAHIISLQGEPVLLTFLNDITELKSAENRLRNSETKLRNIVEHSNEIFYMHDPDNVLTYISPQCQEIMGYSVEEMKINWTELTTGNPINEAGIKNTEKAIKTGQRQPVYILEVKKKDGENIFLEIDESPVKDEHDGVIGIVGAARDITKQKLVEKALLESEKKYRLITENTDDLICIVSFDLKLKFLYASPSYEKKLGYASGELLKKTAYDLVHPQDITDSMPLLKKYLKLKIKAFFQKRIEKFSEVREFRLKHKSGQWSYFSSTINILNKNQILFISHDITEKKKAEKLLKKAFADLKQVQQELIQSGKMAAMGQLAAGISHELAQPLTGIRGFTQTILMDLPGDSPLRNDLEQIIYQADRMDSIIKNVRFFAKKSEFELKDLIITNPIDNALMLLEAQLKRSEIEVRKEIMDNLPMISADANQLQQLFINLITNAKDAILLNKSRDKQINIKVFLSEDQQNLIVVFQDTGGGIPQSQISYIFNPFYTTKAPDGGMGLGLSICYRIVENHNAQIKVESEQGKGATFTISFLIEKK